MKIRIDGDAVFDTKDNLLGEFDNGVFVPSRYLLEASDALQLSVCNSVAKLRAVPFSAEGKYLNLAEDVDGDLEASLTDIGREKLSERLSWPDHLLFNWLFEDFQQAGWQTVIDKLGISVSPKMFGPVYSWPGGSIIATLLSQGHCTLVKE